MRPERKGRDLSANALKDAVLALAEPAVEAEGLSVWGLEILESGRMAIRLFVDMPEPAGGEQPLPARYCRRQDKGGKGLL